MTKTLEDPIVSLPLPPAVRGWPLIGNLLSFQSDPGAFLMNNYEKFGPVFTVQLGPKRIAVLIGKENNQFFFNMTDKLFSLQEVYQCMCPIFGSLDYTLGAPRDKYQEQRKTSLAFFTTNRMPYYFDSMVKETTDWVSKLGPEGQFDMCHTFGVLLMQIASRAFVSTEFRELMGDEFRKQYEHIAAGIDFFLPPSLPLPRFYRRDAARKKLLAMICSFIQRHRSSGYKNDDTLHFMINLKESGFSLTDEALAGIVLKLVFAGQENTHSLLTWGLIQLLQDRDYLNEVFAEQTEIFKSDNTFTEEKLKMMDKLTLALKETERLRPVTTALLRYNIESYERGGYQIPKGWMTMISPFVTHRMPEIFPNPNKYDPMRFSPARDPNKTAHNTLCAFGGGIHKCFGMNLAYMDMKVIISILLRHYELELVTKDPKLKKGLVYVPQGPCIVKYKRR
ncbi:MAG: cytochrome P450 [Parachlamydiaceae bacterium]|nr:cytochrome P450 [Parachlamydiaceae bacterium]